MQLDEIRETCADCAGIILEVSKVVESDPQHCRGGAPNRLAELEGIIDRGLRAIRNSSETGATVLDIFADSGTTMIACEALDRRARLIELEPQYCDVAVTRWQQFAGKEATLDGDGRTFDQITQERQKVAA